MTNPELLEIPIVDADSHVTEPPDLFTSRLPSKYGDLIPRVVEEANGDEVWHVGGHRLSNATKWTAAGWVDTPPSYPRRFDQADHGAWDAVERLRRLDEYGVYAQVLYPNLLAFYMPLFFSFNNPEFTRDCVRAYNDFLADWAATDKARLIPLMMLPFWDVDESVREIERAVALGHKGIVFGASTEKVGLPPITDPAWHPIFAAAQEAELTVNFHVGFGELTEDELLKRTETDGAEHAWQTSLGMLGNSRNIAAVVMGGVCHTFPNLNFVAVESGIGWMPYLMDSFDWHWKNYGGPGDFPERELPSAYMKRQIYGSYWFEKETVADAVRRLPDNFMFETDYPHPTSLSPGPASPARRPADMAHDSLENVPIDVARKVLFENAARLYHLT